MQQFNPPVRGLLRLWPRGRSMIVGSAGRRQQRWYNQPGEVIRTTPETAFARRRLAP